MSPDCLRSSHGDECARAWLSSVTSTGNDQMGQGANKHFPLDSLNTITIMAMTDHTHKTGIEIQRRAVHALPLRADHAASHSGSQSVAFLLPNVVLLLRNLPFNSAAAARV